MGIIIFSITIPHIFAVVCFSYVSCHCFIYAVLLLRYNCKLSHPIIMFYTAFSSLSLVEVSKFSFPRTPFRFTDICLVNIHLWIKLKRGFPLYVSTFKKKNTRLSACSLRDSVICVNKLLKKYGVLIIMCDFF
jgi:hypothetical protein